MIAMCGSAIRSAFLWNGRPKSPWEPLYRFTPSARKTDMPEVRQEHAKQAIGRAIHQAESRLASITTLSSVPHPLPKTGRGSPAHAEAPPAGALPVLRVDTRKARPPWPHPLSSSARQGPFDSGSSGRTGYKKVVSCAWERHSQCLARALLRYDTSCMRDCMLTAKRQHIRRIFV